MKHRQCFSCQRYLMSARVSPSREGRPSVGQPFLERPWDHLNAWNLHFFNIVEFSNGARDRVATVRFMYSRLRGLRLTRGSCPTLSTTTSIHLPTHSAVRSHQFQRCIFNRNQCLNAPAFSHAGAMSTLPGSPCGSAPSPSWEERLISGRRSYSASA